MQSDHFRMVIPFFFVIRFIRRNGVEKRGIPIPSSVKLYLIIRDSETAIMSLETTHSSTLTLTSWTSDSSLFKIVILVVY